MFLFYKEETFPQKITADPKELNSWGIPQVDSVEESFGKSLCLVRGALYKDGAYLGAKLFPNMVPASEYRRPIAICNGYYPGRIRPDGVLQIGDPLNDVFANDTYLQDLIDIHAVYDDFIGVDKFGNLHTVINPIASGEEPGKRVLVIRKDCQLVNKDFCVILEDYSMIYYTLNDSDEYVQTIETDYLQMGLKDYSFVLHRTNTDIAPYCGVTTSGTVFPKLDIKYESSVYNEVKKLLFCDRNYNDFVILYKNGRCFSNWVDLSGFENVKDIAACGTEHLSDDGIYIMDENNILHHFGNDLNDFDGQEAVSMIGSLTANTGPSFGIVKPNGYIEFASVYYADNVSGINTWNTDMSLLTVNGG